MNQVQHTAGKAWIVVKHQGDSGARFDNYDEASKCAREWASKDIGTVYELLEVREVIFSRPTVEVLTLEAM